MVSACRNVVRAGLLVVLGPPLVACGGRSDGASAPARGLLTTTPGVTCDAPAPSGSDAQKACYSKALTACAEGQTPSRIEYEQDVDGNYLVRSYTCA